MTEMRKWMSEACESDLWLKLSAIATIVGMCMVAFWLWQNPTITDVRASSIVQETHVFRPGNSFTVERTYCDIYRRGGYATRYIIGNIDGRTDVYFVDSGDLIASDECPTTRRRWVTIPTMAAPGNYIYRVIISFPVNPLKRVETTLPDIAFQVVK